MPGALVHSPADVLRRVLIQLGVGTLPSANAPWPVYAAGEPGGPDSCLTLFDTQGVDFGRTMTGERQGPDGVQVRIRAANHKAGFTKAWEVAVALDEQVYDETVTIEGSRYLLHSVTRTSSVLALGKETPESKRSLFTINGLVFVRQLA